MITPEQDLAMRLATLSPLDLALPESAQAAVALILGPAGSLPGLELLLIQRAERADDPWSGHMAFPGGRRHAGDADLRATAVRETREETGVELEEARLLGRLDDLRPIRQSERLLAVRPFVFWIAERPALSFNCEVAAAHWVALSALRSAAGEASVLHRGRDLRVPAYTVEGRAVWGLTQRAIAALLELTPRA